MELYNASLGSEEEPQLLELTFEQYQEGKEHFQSIIDRADAARRLAENEDFGLLVLTGYLDNEPKRLADLMASGRLNEKTFNDCTRQIQSVADFRNYMKNFMDQGEMARIELANLEEAYNQALEEAAES